MRCNTKKGYTIYKATVLEFDKATKKVRVLITCDEDETIAKKWCATISLTQEQANATARHGFTSGKVNIGAPVAGAV